MSQICKTGEPTKINISPPIVLHWQFCDISAILENLSYRMFAYMKYPKHIFISIISVIIEILFAIFNLL